MIPGWKKITALVLLLALLIITSCWSVHSYSIYSDLVIEHEAGEPNYYPALSGPERQDKFFYSSLGAGAIALVSILLLLFLAFQPKLLFGLHFGWWGVFVGIRGLSDYLGEGSKLELAFAIVLGLPATIYVLFRILRRNHWELDLSPEPSGRR